MDLLLNNNDLNAAEKAVGPEVKPRSTKELGVRSAIVEDLALKTLYTSGTMSVFELARKTRLSYDVTNEIFGKMRAGLLCQVVGMKGNIPEISITTNGRSRAGIAGSQPVRGRGAGLFGIVRGPGAEAERTARGRP